MSREINRKSEELRTQKIAGQLEHPLSGITRLDKVAHVLNAVWYDKNTKLAGAESFVLDTSKGKDFMTLLDSGLKMGASMRGFGNVSPAGVVQPDYKFDTCDFVLRPSFGVDAAIDQSNIIESANSIFDEKDDKGKNTEDKMMGLSEDYVETMIESIYRTQIDEEFFVGSLEDFRRKKAALIRAEILVAHGHFEDTEQALEYLGEFEEAKRISTAPVPPVQKRVTPNDVYYEAKMAGIDPAVYAERLNASLEEKETSEEERTIRTEIERAGALSGRAKLVPKIEEYPDGEKRRVWVSERETPQQAAERIKDQVKSQKEVLTEDERAEIVAKRTGSTVEFVKEIWAVERNKREKEKKRLDSITSSIREKDMAGFGSETRPDARKRSKKIIEGE